MNAVNGTYRDAELVTEKATVAAILIRPHYRGRRWAHELCAGPGWEKRAYAMPVEDAATIHCLLCQEMMSAEPVPAPRLRPDLPGGGAA